MPRRALHRRHPRPPTRRTPLIQISIGVATLLGLRAEPAYLDGHGPLDPALARRLAKDATWVAMLTEALALTETPSPRTGFDPEAHSVPEPHSDTDTDTDPDSVAAREHMGGPARAAQQGLEAESQSGTGAHSEFDADPAPQSQPEPTAEPSEQPARQCPSPSLAQFKARGTHHAAGYVPNVACPPANPLNTVVDDAVIRATLAELTAGGDGHGGSPNRRRAR